MRRAKGPLKGETIKSIIRKISTDQLKGTYQIIIEINPSQEVHESSYCNNLGYASFNVIPDQRNPFIDVTFDDRQIRDGQVLHTMPNIEISLSDPGSYLLLDDPDDWEVTLYYPQVFRWQVDTSSKDVVWYAAVDIDEKRRRTCSLRRT